MTALNGYNEGKWYLGLIHSSPSVGEKEAPAISLNHMLQWRRTCQLITLLQGSQSQHYDILNWKFLCCRGVLSCDLQDAQQHASLYPLNISSTLPPICDNQKYFQTSSNASLGAKLSVVEKHCPRYSLPFIWSPWSPHGLLILIWLSRVVFLLKRGHPTN